MPQRTVVTPRAPRVMLAYGRIAARMEREAENLPTGPDRDAIEACATKLRRHAPAGPRRIDYRDSAPARGRHV